MGGGPREGPNLKTEPFLLLGLQNKSQHISSPGWFSQARAQAFPLPYLKK